MILRPDEKMCSTCKEVKGLFCFGRKRGTPDGREYSCSPCINKKQAENRRLKRLERESIVSKISIETCSDKYRRGAFLEYLKTRSPKLYNKLNGKNISNRIRRQDTF